MNFDYSPRVQLYQERLHTFIERHVLPANQEWHRLTDSGAFPAQLIDARKELAKSEGLWNMFLPALRNEEPGTRMTNLEYAPLAEIMGRLPWSAEVFNCNAPDTGNMEMLHLCATRAQYQQWLLPLLEGEIRSCFAMTEPDVASSDATNIQTTIRRDGDEYVINGRKWFTTGALHPRCTFAIVMGVSDASDSAPSHRRHSMVVVPLDTRGVRMVRNVPIMHHYAVEGHCEMLFSEVRVPCANLLGEEGGGFALAQARLGPGRIHHCMRSVGQCELALELMCERVLQRKAFGKYLADYANIQDWIAESRLEIDQARLLVLRAAALIDRAGNQAARVDVSAIKLVAARLQTRVLDRAMQVFGAMGLTSDTPLAFLWSWGRALRFIDGPDEVHLRVVAKEELKRAKGRFGELAPYYTGGHNDWRNDGKD
jgi:acyl-CoA dehydrogenase